jgi:hypothetical protein
VIQHQGSEALSAGFKANVNEARQMSCRGKKEERFVHVLATHFNLEAGRFGAGSPDASRRALAAKSCPVDLLSSAESFII